MQKAESEGTLKETFPSPERNSRMRLLKVHPKPFILPEPSRVGKCHAISPIPNFSPGMCFKFLGNAEQSFVRLWGQRALPGPSLP